MLEPSSAAALCLQLAAEEAALCRLSTVKKHPETMHMGGDAGQLRPKVLPRVIFAACVYLMC